MANAFDHSNGAAPRKAGALDWRKKMSDTIAYALLVYTGLQIYFTMQVLHVDSGGSLLPYFALIVLVVAIIPACRLFERRWNRLNDVQAADLAFAPRFRRDRLMVWLLAIGLPFLVTGMFRLLAMAFA
jgi:hypothetical protein